MEELAAQLLQAQHLATALLTSRSPASSEYRIALTVLQHLAEIARTVEFEEKYSTESP